MSARNLYLLRMVIQQIGVTYRVVVYGDWDKPRHADFSSGQVLLEALHATLTDFDTSSLTFDPLRQGQGCIVFTGEIELNDRQLGLLGLAGFSV